MAIALLNTRDHCADWADALRRLAPEMDIRVWPDVGDKAEITHAIVCNPELGALKQLPNLKAMHSLWAGIDHITRDPEAPMAVPLIRMVDHSLSQGMLDYVTGYVYRYHLEAPRFEALQRTGTWEQTVPPLVEERHVGIMGLGVLGAEIGKQLAGLGFRVSGWARTRKQIEGIRAYAGMEELESFLSGCEILALLLPNTAETTDILNAETLAMLPKGAAIINAGRGTLINDEALIAALESGAISEATLDVFKTEPLPSDHPYWTHPKVRITPHVAAETRISSASEVVIKNIRFLEEGGSLSNIEGVVDTSVGY